MGARVMLPYRCPCGSLMVLDPSGVSNPVKDSRGRVVLKAWVHHCGRPIPQEQSCVYCGQKKHVREMTRDLLSLHWACRKSKGCVEGICLSGT